ncbi:hypothetical protein GCM10009765_47950 [Fodinicola feengrottensis]|uniref:ABC transporter permease n=1 Tax=Fodinicola feengrottensis TaxID=435914 RepID=A0ABP4TTE8_9ACTN
MVGVLIRLKLDVLRRSYGGGRSALTIAGATVGLVLAGATLIVGSRDAAGDVLCLAFAMWTVGWIVGPMVTGGDTSLRPQYFALLPIPMRRLATGLFGAAFVGVPAVVTLAAFGALVLHGFRLGFGPGLVAIPAALLQLAVVVLLSKLLSGGIAEIEKTRPGREIPAAVLGFAVSFMILGPLALSILGPRIVQPWPRPLALLVHWLPTGWATSAVDGAADGGVLVTISALGGLVVLAAGLLFGWARLLRRTLAPSARGLAVHAGRPAGSGFAAVVGKELHSYARDTLRGRLVRMAFWTSVFVCLLTSVAHAGFVVAFIGLLAVVFMTMLAGNWYGADGTALWLGMMVPGTERTDLRGRQVAWVVLAGSLGVSLSIVGGLIARQAWTIPYVLAGLPALLGGGAGLLAVFSVAAPIVKADPHRRTTNPADSGTSVGGQIVQAQVLLYLAVVSALPALGTVLAGSLTHSGALSWAGAGVGVLTGTLLAWIGGLFATGQLRRRGPELLTRLRKGITPAAAPKVAAQEPRHRLIFLWLSGGFFGLCQGLLPLVSIARGAGTNGRFWYVPLYLPAPLQLPFASTFLLVGTALIAGAAYATWARRNAKSR